MKPGDVVTHAFHGIRRKVVKVGEKFVWLERVGRVPRNPVTGEPVGYFVEVRQ